jgi:hypothetical protein
MNKSAKLKNTRWTRVIEREELQGNYKRGEPVTIFVSDCLETPFLDPK